MNAGEGRQFMHAGTMQVRVITKAARLRRLVKDSLVVALDQR